MNKSLILTGSSEKFSPSGVPLPRVGKIKVRLTIVTFLAQRTVTPGDSLSGEQSPTVRCAGA